MSSHTVPSERFASFAALAAHLETLGLFRMRPELGRLKEVLAVLDWSRPAAVVQIAGTNGKGSTATFIAAIAQAHGLRVGLYTSPHFISFRERIRLNGAPVPEEILLQPANRIMAAGGAGLTYFELVTALAALIFSPDAPTGVDLAIMKTGLGGTWAAVPALSFVVFFFVFIGLDHCGILGKTVAAITEDKAEAIREGKPVFSVPQLPESLRVLSFVAASRNAPFFMTHGRADLPPAVREGRIPLGLAGEHQFVNAGLALNVWRYLAMEQGWPVIEEKERDGLASAFIPGRMQFVPPSPEHGHPALLLDGAHNGHGMAALGGELARRGIAPAAVIFSCLEDKNPAEMASHLRVLATGPVFVPPIGHNPRALPPEELARIIGLNARPVVSMAEALRFAAKHVSGRLPEEAVVNPERHPVLVCGSLYMLGDFFTLRPDCLEMPAAEKRKGKPL